jgi:gliding motility-associated-like protein
MRTQLLFIGCILFYFGVNAQSPAWSIDASQYNYSMVMVGLIKVDGVETLNPNDKIAAFINGELRGVASPILQKHVNRNIFYLIIYHNDDGGTVHFKYYDSKNDKVTSAVQYVPFSVDGLIGDTNKPFVWSNRTLKTEAKILTYKIDGQLGSRIYNDSIVVRLNVGTKLSSQKLHFSVSEGAGLYLGNERQVSGTYFNNLDGPFTLTVRSEDEQTIKEYNVIVREELDEIANVLLPNGSEQNRTWGISNLGIYEKVKINVFDQNGHVLFSASDPQHEWDGRYNGKPVAEGIYFYSIDREDGRKQQGTIQVIY